MKMNDICSQCKFQFFETSIQEAKRKGGPLLCKSCSRIINAEKRQQERINPKKKKIELVSIPYLMRKLKITHQQAKEMALSS